MVSTMTGRSKKKKVPGKRNSSQPNGEEPAVDAVEQQQLDDVPEEDYLPEIDSIQPPANQENRQEGQQLSTMPGASATAEPPPRRSTRQRTRQQQEPPTEPVQQGAAAAHFPHVVAPRGERNGAAAKGARNNLNSGLDALVEAAEIAQITTAPHALTHNEADPRSALERSLENWNDELPHESTLTESMDVDTQEEEPVEQAPRGRGRPRKVAEVIPSTEPVVIDFFVTIKAVQHRVKLPSDTEWSVAEDKLLEKLHMRQKAVPQLAFKLSDAPQREDPRIFDSSEYDELVRELERHGHSMKRDARIKPKSVAIFVRKELEAAKESKAKGSTSLNKKRKKAQSPSSTESSGSGSEESGSDGSDASQGSQGSNRRARRKKKRLEKKGGLTISKALEKIEDAQRCALHNRACKVGPDGDHTPYTVEEKQYWAVLAHKGQATEMTPPPGIINGNFIRVHHQKPKEPKREATPQPIQIQFAPPPIPNFSSQYLLQAPGVAGSRAVSSNHNVPSSDGLEEDPTLFPTIRSFLSDINKVALAATPDGEDYRNLSQFINTLVVENGYVRIQEIYDRYREEKDGHFLKTKLEYPLSTTNGTADFLWNQIRKKVKLIRKSGRT